jgi:outer membrane protein assembly factor BamD
MLSDVPGPGGSTADSSTGSMSNAMPSSGSGTGVGVEVLSPNGGAAPAVVAKPAFAPVSDLPAATGAKDPNYGLKTVAPADASALPAIEKAAEAPDQINEAGKSAPLPQDKTAANGKKKTKAPKEDKTDESSSKDKKKKGLDKLNPF